MSKRQRRDRQKNPMRTPKSNKKGKVKMNRHFNVGQRVRFKHSPDVSPHLSPMDGAAVKIIDYMAHPVTRGGHRYLVRFPTGGQSWVPESVLFDISSRSFSGEEIETPSSNVKLFVSIKTDCWGYKFTVSTKRASKHAGWATTINHQAYNGGAAIVIAFCYTNERAEVMHNNWVKILTSGPLPDSVEEAGLGEWKRGTVSHMRSAMYKAIPLT